MTKQRGTIEQRSGSWGYRFSYTDDTGKRQHVKKYSKSWTQKDAQKALTAQLALVDSGHNLGSNRATVGSYLQRWFDEWSNDKDLKRSTIDTARVHLDVYLIPRIGTMKLRDLKPSKLSAVYRDIQAEGRVGGNTPLSAKTVRNIAGTLHKALSDAVENGLLVTNPAQHAKVPKYQRPPLTTYNDEQVAVFLRHCEQTQNDHLALWCLLLLIGLRRGELLGLTWADVDLVTSEIQIRQTRSVNSSGVEYIDTPKTDAGKRYLTIDPYTLDALARLKDAHETAARHLGGWTSEYVATDLDGRPIHPRAITRRFQALARDAGLPQIRLHDGRHTALTIAVDAGVDIHVVSARAGHTRASFTADTYLHRHRSTDHKAANTTSSRIMDKMAALDSDPKWARNGREMGAGLANSDELDDLTNSESL